MREVCPLSPALSPVFPVPTGERSCLNKALPTFCLHNYELMPPPSGSPSEFFGLRCLCGLGIGLTPIGERQVTKQMGNKLFVCIITG